MIQLMYTSKNEIPRGRRLQELGFILSTASRDNSKNSVTGYLIADGNRFFQILEGETSNVQLILERIRADPRHSNLKLIETRGSISRSFPEWSMGGWMCDPETIGIFMHYGFGENSDQSGVTWSSVMGLASALRDFQAARERVRTAV